jgi:hypothetical protein
VRAEWFFEAKHTARKRIFHIHQVPARDGRALCLRENDNETAGAARKGSRSQV